MNKFIKNALTALAVVGSGIVSVPTWAANYHVILMGGQSNMDGHWQTSKGAADGAASSQLPSNLQQAQTNVLFNNTNDQYGYRGTPNSYDTGNTLSALQPGAYFGPEITFGQKIAADNPSNQYLLIKYAVPGTDLNYQWNLASGTDMNQGYIYKAFRSAVTKALSLLPAGSTYQIDGMLWLQGEQDASEYGNGGTGNTQAAANYKTNLTNFIGSIRSNYGANLPFIIGGIGYTNDGHTQTDGLSDRAEVQSAFSYAATNMSNVRYFNNDDLLGATNDLHFTAPMMQTIGQRFASNLEAVPEPTSVGTLIFGAIWAGARRHPVSQFKPRVIRETP